MIEASNPILIKMLDRLFAAMLNGPSMNCRPHASRQRTDLVQLSRLKDIAPWQVMLNLMGEEGMAKITARVPLPVRAPKADDGNIDSEAQTAWAEQQGIRNKLRVIAEDARTYEQDTGVHALNGRLRRGPALRFSENIPWHTAPDSTVRTSSATDVTSTRSRRLRHRQAH